MSIFYINANKEIMSSAAADYKMEYEGMSRSEAYEGYIKMGASEILDAINAAESWDAIEEDMYKQLCDELDLDYDAYDDYAALTEAATDKLDA